MTDDRRLSAGECHPDDHCQLCGDDASVGRVMSIDAAAGTARVDLACGPTSVALDLVDARVGDEVLVHMGFAIQRVEPA